MWPIPNISKEIGEAVTEAPRHLFEGIVQAIAFVPDQFKGAAVFGAGIWNGLTPEQQTTVQQAISKLIVTAAEAYVKKDR